jgi:CheY-like chemotaxis protein
VLLKNRRGTFADEELSFLNRVAANGKHLLGLINDILDLSKIEAGRMSLEIETVMLDTVIRETMEELEGQVRDKEIMLRVELPDVIQSIDTDAARMKQVLINLIGNSVKFTEVGEVLVKLEADAEGKPVRLTVRDTGIGIPQDRLAAIFNVFEQAESTTSRRFGGTGLGLAISRSLCELMGHHLEVESVEGRGTTMHIRLGGTPRTWRRSTPMSAPTVPPTPRLSGEISPVVLVVDDDADARAILAQYLATTGCRVMFASSGIDALRMARELMPAMIFLDLRLPRISGFDVLRIIRSDETLRETPVVIVSVAGSESRGALQGATAILDKPVSREQVFAVVRRWLPSSVPV